MTVAPSAEVAEAFVLPQERTRTSLLRELWRAKSATLAALVLLAIGAVALFAPLIAPTKLGHIDLASRLQEPVLFGGSWDHPLGTDALGQDELTQLVYGARVSVSTGVIVILLAGSFGTLLGLVAGYVRGWRETVAMRLVEVSIAFPGLLLALAVLTMVGAGQSTLIFILSALSWMVFARVTHDIVLGLRETPFVKAAETVGCSRTRLIFRHLLPNLASALLTIATLEFAAVVLAEASLSYLGFGIQPPDSSWGLMVANGQQYLDAAWWLVAIPGFAIALTVLALNLLAGWLRVTADPRQRDKQLATLRKRRGRLLRGKRSIELVTTRRETAFEDTVPLLEVRNLKVEFSRSSGTAVHAVRDVSLRLERGETLALVGESGSGKSVTALAIQGLISPPGQVSGGEIVWRFHERNEGSRRVPVVGDRVTMVFQDPLASLNPLMPIGKQIAEAIRRRDRLSRAEACKRAVELLGLVGISAPERRLKQFPHEFSGGMAQRVMLATAIAPRPELIIADEPTTALDVTIQSQILELLRQFQSDLGMSLMLISHDLGVVAGICDRVAVMYAGRIVEQGTADDVFKHPRHPYTAALLGCTPRLDQPRRGRMLSIAGTAPSATSLIEGCAFARRCPRASETCRERPSLHDEARQQYACWHPLPTVLEARRRA